jgi:hypothetical protein
MVAIQRSGAQKSGALALVFGLLLCGAAFAAPFTLTATLTGDPRPDSPDDLIIKVTVTGDDAASPTVQWKVEINSPAHPDAKLDEFYANLLLPTGYSVDFLGFTPSDWQVESPATVLGGGSIDFSFEAFNAFPAGPGDDVTSSQPLTFSMILFEGPGDPASGFDPTILTGAPCSPSSDQRLSCGQLGAHLQSLTIQEEGQSDSGFLLGNWDERVPPTGVPEPGSIALFGAALLGFAGFRKRRKS